MPDTPEIPAGPRAEQITIPDGVRRYSIEESTFGLRDMFPGEVQAYSGPGKQTIDRYIKGTFLRFDPGNILIAVARQNLEADQINRMGELGRELNRNLRLREYLERVMDLTSSELGNLESDTRFPRDATTNRSPEEIHSIAESRLEEETAINPDRYPI